MPKKLFWFLILLILIYEVILLVSGGFSVRFGGLTILFERTSDPILLIILLAGIQFLSARSFRCSVKDVISKIVQNRKRLIAFVLGLIIFEMVLGFLHVYFSGRTFAFDLDREFNLPTYFSAILFLLNFFIIGTIYYSEKNSGLTQKEVWVISIIFLFLSLDELGRFHEATIPFLERNIPSLVSVFNSNKYWVVVMIPFILLTIFLLFTLMYRKLRIHPWLLAGTVLALILWIIVLWLELWEGYPAGTYKFKVLVEEEFEMLGSTVFLSVFLVYLKIQNDRHHVLQC